MPRIAGMYTHQSEVLKEKFKHSEHPRLPHPQLILARHPPDQVVDKDANAVLDEVEAAILLVTASIMRGEGFSYAIPNRSKGNQIYVPGR
jgi:hypothetical protein